MTRNRGPTAIIDMGESTARELPRLRRLLLVLLPVLIGLALIGGYRATTGSSSFDGFHERTIEALGDTKNPYRGTRAYAPAFYALFAPLALLPLDVAAFLWVLASCGPAHSR